MYTVNSIKQILNCKQLSCLYYFKLFYPCSVLLSHIRCLYQQCSVLGWFCFLKGSFKVGCFLSTESWRALASIQCHSTIQDIATPLASIFLHCETTMDQAFLGVRIWQRTKQAMISCSSEEVPLSQARVSPNCSQGMFAFALPPLLLIYQDFCLNSGENKILLVYHGMKKE